MTIATTEDSEGDEVQVVEDKQHLKFEKALSKCVKVASGKKFASSRHLQDTRTPLFIEIQDICKTLNSNVDAQAKDRKFRFADQPCIEGGEIRESLAADGETGSDGYISLDDDVAYLFDDDEEKHSTYYGCIAGITLQEEKKSRFGVVRKYTHRVGSLLRLKTTGVALIHWYREAGIDEEGNTLLELPDDEAPEAMSTDGIMCCIKLHDMGRDTGGNHRFQLAKAAVEDHKDILRGYDSGNIPKGAAVKATRRAEKVRHDKGPTLRELKEACRKKGLPTSGKKCDLMKRLEGNVLPKALPKTRKTRKRKAAALPESVGGFAWGASHFLGRRNSVDKGTRFVCVCVPLLPYIIHMQVCVDLLSGSVETNHRFVC